MTELTNQNSEFATLLAIARMGFSVVPIGMVHKDKGMGLLYMDMDGLRFQPDDGKEPLKITWEEFDKSDGE